MGGPEGAGCEGGGKSSRASQGGPPAGDGDGPRVEHAGPGNATAGQAFLERVPWPPSAGRPAGEGPSWVAGRPRDIPEAT